MADLSAEVTENYLKQIYHLSLDRVPVKTTELAQALSLCPAAVTTRWFSGSVQSNSNTVGLAVAASRKNLRTS